MRLIPNPTTLHALVLNEIGLAALTTVTSLTASILVRHPCGDRLMDAELSWTEDVLPALHSGPNQFLKLVSCKNSKPAKKDDGGDFPSPMPVSLARAKTITDVSQNGYGLDYKYIYIYMWQGPLGTLWQLGPGVHRARVFNTQTSQMLNPSDFTK